MTTSIEHLDRSPPVLGYAGPSTSVSLPEPGVPWLAVGSGLLAWVPVFLSFAFGPTQAIWIAPILGFIGLIIAAVCTIDRREQPYVYHVAGALSLASTLAGTIIAIAALLS
jgi:hypothetical protein